MKKRIAGFSRIWIVVCVALFCASPCRAEATPPASLRNSDIDVSHNHWAYEALYYLMQKGLVEIEPATNRFRPYTFTRYEFAVAIARLVQKSPYTRKDYASFSVSERAEINDVIDAFRHEFARELADMGVRIPIDSDYLSGQRTVVPRLPITPSILHHAKSLVSPNLVPRNHWAYEAFDLLNTALGENIMLPKIGEKELLTRWRFAFAVAHIMDVNAKHPYQSNSSSRLTNTEFTDLLDALKHEFAAELKVLGIQPSARWEIHEFARSSPHRASTPSLLHRVGKPAAVQPAESPDVPRNHWAHKAVDYLAQKWVLEESQCPFVRRPNRSWTRYEFAVALARILQNKRSNVADSEIFPLTTDAEANDALAALLREFMPELKSFNEPSLLKRQIADRAKDNPIPLNANAPFALRTPLISWSYLALDMLEARLGKLPKPIPFPKRDKGVVWTRQAFAIATARLLRQYPVLLQIGSSVDPPEAALLAPLTNQEAMEVDDLISALRREFREEGLQMGILPAEGLHELPRG